MALTKIDDRGLKTPIDLLDAEKIRFGTDNDLQIHHSAHVNYISSKTGNIVINRVNGEAMAKFIPDGAVELYHDASKKLETTANGIELSGSNSIFLGGKIDMPDSSSTSTGRILLGTGDDLSFFHDGTNSVIDNITGELQIATDAVMRFQATEYKFNNAANNEKIANFFQNGACELYFDHSKKLETGIGGEYGSFTATNGSNGWDGMAVGNSKFVFMGSDSQEAVGIWNDLDNEWMVKCVRNAETQLQYNGSKKLETSASGIALSGDLTFTGTSEEITLQTSDGSDNGYLNLSGGGACAQTRGAQLVLSGNERSGGLGGVLQLLAGNSGSTSVIQFYTSGSEVGRFDNNGRFAVGRTSPVTKVHIEDSSNLSLRLTKTSSSDAEIKNTDSLDLCCSSGGSGGQIIRMLTGATPSNLVEHMRVTGGGHIFFSGMTDLTAATTNKGVVIEKQSNYGRANFHAKTGAGTVPALGFYHSGGSVGFVNYTSSSVAYLTSSDYRLKENVTAISDAITRLKTLKPSRFNFKVDPDKKVDGFLAHEVTAVPEAITGTKDEVATEDDENRGIKKGDPIYQGIDQSKLVPLLTAALQEEISKREALETRVAALEAA